MSLTFHSVYPGTVWVTILYYQPGCSSGLFAKEGWWSLANGESKVVYGGDVKDLNRYYYFYAEASDGSVWNGPVDVSVTQAVFNQCVWDNDGDSRTVGFQLLDIGSNDNYTVNLVPAGYKSPPSGGGGGGWPGGDDDGDDDDDDDDDDEGGDEGDDD